MHPRRAFSLVELLVVLAILGVFAGAASVRLSASAERARVDAAARRIVNALEDAQSRARSASVKCKVRFIANPPTVEVKGPLTGHAALDSIRLDQSPYRVRLKNTSLGGRDGIEFDRYGRPDTGGYVLVTSGRFDRTNTVDPESGRATIH
jgi:prepilin-type N-terminal cleavage/methylation domain-containing protein